jgi:Family of unknown function (DUF6527)
MTRRTTIQHQFVDTVPDALQEGVVYVCIPYTTAVHRCLCGCGEEVVTPIRPTGWSLTFDGVTVSLHPSIGNWDFPCRSHYGSPTTGFVGTDSGHPRRSPPDAGGRTPTAPSTSARPRRSRRTRISPPILRSGGPQRRAACRNGCDRAIGYTVDAAATSQAQSDWSYDGGERLSAGLCSGRPRARVGTPGLSDPGDAWGLPRPRATTMGSNALTNDVRTVLAGADRWRKVTAPPSPALHQTAHGSGLPRWPGLPGTLTRRLLAGPGCVARASAEDGSGSARCRTRRHVRRSGQLRHGSRSSPTTRPALPAQGCCQWRPLGDTTARPPSCS